LLFTGRWTIDKKLNDQTYAANFRDDLMEEVKTLKDEVKALKSESDSWRTKYWVLAEEIPVLRQELASLQAQVNKNEGGAT